jgi:hypothetical protein
MAIRPATTNKQESTAGGETIDEPEVAASASAMALDVSQGKVAFSRRCNRCSELSRCEAQGDSDGEYDVRTQLHIRK